jgi:ribosomal protein S18 acetylase RimI-like enzyme
VRSAEPAELAAVGRLCVAAYRAGGHLGDGDAYVKTLADARARAATAEVLVAVRNDAIVGTVTICPPGSEWSEVCHEAESEFRFLAVDPAAWRTGVGESLVNACEMLARERGQSAHVICVIDRNEGGHAFYRDLGFERLPERDWQPVPGIMLLAYTRRVPYEATNS